MSTIEGLDQVREAYESNKAYCQSFDDFLEDGDSCGPPDSPDVNYEEIRKKYPRAEAWMEAWRKSCSEWIGQSIPARRAMRRLEDEPDTPHEQILADMKKEIKVETRRAALMD